MAYPELDLEEELKRKRIEAALSSDTDYPASDAQPDQPPKDIRRVYGDWSKWPSLSPEEAADIPTIEQPVLPAGHIDLTPPGHIDLAPPQVPTTQEIRTDPETGTRFAIDKDSGQMVPRAELATLADKQAFKPSDAQLPQIDVTGDVPVRRGTLVTLPTSPTEPMTPSPSGVPQPDLRIQPVQPAPGTLTQVEKALPAHEAAPDQLTQVERALPTGPKAPGTHTELAPPGQMDLRPDELPAQKPVVKQPAVKPASDDWRAWMTADGTPADPSFIQPEAKAPTSVDTLKAGEGNRVDPGQLFSYLRGKFSDSGLVGYVPPDGARWGINTGSAAEWAAFGLAVAKQESDLNTRSYNASDPGGSVGLFQFGQGQTQFTKGGNQFDAQESADAFVRSVQHYVGNEGSVANLGATFGSIRRPNEAGQYIGYAQEVAAKDSGGTLSAPKKEDWESWATLSPAEQSDAEAQGQSRAKGELEAQQNILTAVHEHSANMPAFYHALEKEIPGVPDTVRNATREDFKKEITKYAQDYYQEPDPDKAFARIMEAPNLLTSAGEIITKAPAHVQHALLAMSRSLDANGENRIIDFVNNVHPEATPEARAAFVREILSKPAGNERTQFVSALYSSVDPQITQGISLPTLLDSIDTISQPGYQEKRTAEIKAAVDKNLKDLRTDPTMVNTWGGTVSGAIAQMPKNLGEALFPVIGQSAMTSEIYFDTLEGLRKEHPDWSEDKLKATAGAAAVPQVALQEIVNLATMGLGGGFTKSITNPAARIAANSILHGTVAAVAGTVQQGVANRVMGRPITEGLPEAAVTGGIQGMIGGAMHAPEAQTRVEKAVAEPPSPEATTGPGGEPIRRATDETLTETAPMPKEPPPLPIEAHSDQNLEQRSIAPIRTPEEGERGMTQEEADAWFNSHAQEVEARHQARAGDVGLIPSDDHPQATVHSNLDESPVPAPPERFSLGAEIPSKGLSVPEAQKVTDTFREQFPHAPPIDIVNSRAELPQHLRAAIAQHAGNHSVEALIHDGRIHVVAGENTSSEALHRTLLEEAIGHYGVEQVLGSKFNHLTDVVSKSMTGHPQYEALKAVYGDNPRTLAAEYIARAARGQIETPSVWAHVKTWFNQLARRLGFKRAFSDSELRVLLSRARGRLEKGGGRSVVSLSPPRFRLTSDDVEIARPSKEELPGKHWYSPSRLVQGPRWIRSAYDQLAANPHTAGLAQALMHRVDRSQELYTEWIKPIREAFKGIKKGELKTVLADFAKLQEAKDNKQPQPTGLHPDAYKIERAVRATSEKVAELAKANKILVFDPRLDGGKGGYRPFRATSDYVPRNVKREVIDAMRLRNNGDKAIARWTGIVHEFIDKGYAKNEAEVIAQIKGAANLDTKHIDSKMGNLEKARVSRLPSSMYEYSLTGMLDYIRRASDRMSEVEAYGQRGELFQKVVDRIEKSPLAGSEQGSGLINMVKAVRNRELGLNEHTNLGKGLAIMRSFATGTDLSGWMGMFNDLIGSVSVVPSQMGIWNTAKGYYHALTHFKQMMSDAEDLGVIHEDYGRATREIEHNYQTGSLSDKLGRIGSKTAEFGLAVSGRTTQERFIRTMTLGATKQMLRNAVDTIRKNPASRQAGAWAHYLQRRGVDVSKLVAEGGEGPESNRLMRRAVADTQAGYDLIQRSPWMESPGGKFFGQYMSWGVNQTRNVMREIVLPILRPTQKTIDVTVNGKKYTVSDSRFTAIQRGLMLAVAGSATGMLTDQLREFFLGRIQSYRDLKQLAVDIATHPDKAETFAHLANSMTSELLTGGMTGMLGNFAQLLMDPTNKQRYKDPLHPTGFTKLEQIGQFFKRSMQEGQYNSHEADALLKNWFGVYREGKPIVARTMSTLGYSPNWVKEERTRQSVAALRNTLRRYNDEQGLGLKPPAFSSDYDASKHTPIAQSVVDALYRGDAAGAKKILDDYMKAAPNAAEAKARKDSVTSSVQSATPLKLGSKSNKEFAQGFWDWAQVEGNVTPAQIADYKKAVNEFADTAFNAGFKRELQIVPEEGDKKIVIAKKVSRTAATALLKEMIRKENATQALMAH